MKKVTKDVSYNCLDKIYEKHYLGEAVGKNENTFKSVLQQKTGKIDK